MNNSKKESTDYGMYKGKEKNKFFFSQQINACYTEIQTYKCFLTAAKCVACINRSHSVSHSVSQRWWSEKANSIICHRSKMLCYFSKSCCMCIKGCFLSVLASITINPHRGKKYDVCKYDICFSHCV